MANLSTYEAYHPGVALLLRRLTIYVVLWRFRPLKERGREFERAYGPSGEWTRLFQLGDSAFPPLRTLNNSNVPLAATPLLGRKKELADVLRLFTRDGARLVTITGAGGVGKTRFALELAHELVEQFAHGVWFVDLSPLRDPTLVVRTIEATVGADRDLVDHVAEKELLLVLDNFEHVADAAPELAELVRRCANVRVLATSREPLHIGGERAYPLRPLAEAPAVELLRSRAEAGDPDFDAPFETLAEIAGR